MRSARRKVRERRSHPTSNYTTACLLIIIIKFSVLEQELSPLSQMQGGFTRALLSNIR